MMMESSLREKPERHKTRRLTDHLKLAGKNKVHSLVDKVYQYRNLELAWEKVRSNQGASGIDRITIEEFEENQEKYLRGLHQMIREKIYHPQAVRRIDIPKRGLPGKGRPLGIPTILDRVCQQALVNRLEPIFEEIFDPSSYGYRRGRKTSDALKKIWHEVDAGNSWVVDADLKDYFGSVDHEKLMKLVSQRVSDGRILTMIRQFLEAGYEEKGKHYPTPKGTPQGGVISPLLSNILLTPFDKEMRRKGYKLTRWADDWVVTCQTRREAQSALAAATKILNKLGVRLNKGKTGIVNVMNGFEFLGFKIKRGVKPMRLNQAMIKTRLNKGRLYAIPTQKSVDRFKQQIRNGTQRKIPKSTEDLIEQINPIIRGWGNYYKKSHVKRLFNRLDRWVIRRLWSHRYKRWRNTGWRKLSTRRLRRDLGLVSLVRLIPMI